ncbi:MAG: thermonuclease family protein [Verrucomicrobiae bacterium]|nr:thermonuclease family protein [Verrucomicrobiae bacterium]
MLAGLLLPLLLWACAVSGADLRGRVVSVSDGDTLKVVSGRKETTIRLAGIDAPERRQPYSEQAKRALSEMVFGKDVRVVIQDTDRYGRTVGVVYVGRKQVNLELVRMGLAWHYRQYSDDKDLARAEVEARKARRGLWADRKPVAPWDWRRANAAAARR